MSNRILSLSAALALTLGASAALAEPAMVHGAKTVGALTLETRGLATSPAEIRRQGGFATAGAVRWSAPSDVRADAVDGAVYGAGSVGALSLEAGGRATSFADVRRQGGAATASAVRWVPGRELR